MFFKLRKLKYYFYFAIMYFYALQIICESISIVMNIKEKRKTTE